MNDASIAPWFEPPQLRHTQRLLNSFRHWTGRDLMAREGSALEQARALFEAPFVVVSHGTETDPILNYGNRAALTLWEMDWAAFTRTPSRETAEPLARDERARLLARVTAQGYIRDYSGIRISSSGKRFKITNAWVWNLRDETGGPCGQAASFSAWEMLGEQGA